MSSIRKSFVAAGKVAALAGFVWLGSTLRDRADLTQPVLNDGIISGLRASNENDDTQIPAGDFFYELTEKLKKEYVEPIKDEQKLATGAVRGMVGFLGDPKSIYMDKDEFRAFLNSRQGRYEGIGADFALLTPTPGAKATRSALQPTPTEESADPSQLPTVRGGGKGVSDAPQFPRLTVTSVVPGGPADRAGVKAGDVVQAVDGHWVINGDVIAQFNKAVDAFKAKKIDLAAFNKVRNEVRQKYERPLLPLRAKDRLALGSSGRLKIEWLRDGVSRTTDIIRGTSERVGFTEKGDTLVLPFAQGSPEQLKKAIAGKTSVTIDLRNNTVGDFETMRQCLAEIAPAGTYGQYTSERNEKGTPLSVQKGNANPPKIKLLTDRTTRGAAEIFALALSSRGLAKLTGEETGGDRDIYDVIALPDGTGYTLVTGHYRPDLTTNRVAATSREKSL